MDAGGSASRKVRAPSVPGVERVADAWPVDDVEVPEAEPLSRADSTRRIADLIIRLKKPIERHNGKANAA
ncbi:hypothetical protein Cme02nite_31670 [Catellatospora methionotrophica]|uniref:Uncharacterized protein n=1 Tax=Catellatospora methionotrophica TaxID=121620 RepID=A0A8J3LLE7_9ACTN|nr:hypothetical protein Cme02nite_31670 [Catellatospora methionotrophica]